MSVYINAFSEDDITFNYQFLQKSVNQHVFLPRYFRSIYRSDVGSRRVKIKQCFAG